MCRADISVAPCLLHRNIYTLSYTIRYTYYFGNDDKYAPLCLPSTVRLWVRVASAVTRHGKPPRMLVWAALWEVIRAT